MGVWTGEARWRRCSNGNGTIIECLHRWLGLALRAGPTAGVAFWYLVVPSRFVDPAICRYRRAAMWGDDGSDDEYLAALDNFEARAATLPKQQQPCGNQTGLHTAPNQPAPLQQRNGAVAPPPPPPALPLSCPPVGLGQAALAAPLVAAGVRHLFRRPSAGGPGLAAPAPGAMPPAAGASPAPTSSGWRHQQDQQQPGPNHHHQLQQHQQHQRGSSGQAGVLQQAAPWSVGPPLPSTHQRQPGAQQQQQPSPWPAPQHIGAAHWPQPLQTPPWQPSVQQQQKPPPQHQQPAQMPAPQLPPQQQTQQQPPQQQQQQQQGCGSSAATTVPVPQPALADAQQQAKTVGAGKQSAGGAANAQTAAAAPGAGEISRAAAVEHEAPAAAGEAAAASPGAASADAATATAAAGAQPKRKLQQLFDYLLVYDMEATCDSDKSKQPQPQVGGFGPSTVCGRRARLLLQTHALITHMPWSVL